MKRILNVRLAEMSPHLRRSCQSPRLVEEADIVNCWVSIFPKDSRLTAAVSCRSSDTTGLADGSCRSSVGITQRRVGDTDG